MPRVRLLVGRSGIAESGAPFSQIPGDEIEVSAETAKRMIEDGAAVPVTGSKKRTATRKPTEARADALDANTTPSDGTN